MQDLSRRGSIALLGAGAAGAAYLGLRSQAVANGSTNDAGVAKAALPQVLRDGPDFPVVTLTQLPIGGGGFVTGLDISSDGRRFVCRTDVANAYVRDEGEAAWRPLFSPDTMVRRDYDPLPALNNKADGQGVAAVRIAPSNKDVIAASYYGYIWISEDGGRSVRRSGLPQQAMPSNAGLQRLYNRTLDIHPSDPRQMLVGTAGEGAWYTVDGGNRWSRIDLPQSGKSLDNLPGLYLVAFDPQQPSRVYVFVSGVGLFSSDTGLAGKFVPIAGGPRHCSSLVAAPDGRMFLCEVMADYQGRVWRYTPAAGWKASRPEHEAAVLAIDPTDPMRVVVSNPNGYFIVSQDGGESWSSKGGPIWSAAKGEVGWTRNLKTVFPAEIHFDRRAKDRLLVAQGVGVAAADLRTSPFELADWSAGIEELCAVSALVVPGGETFLSAWDKSFWRVDSRTAYVNDHRYPLTAGAEYDPSLVAYGSYMDYAVDDPRFVAAVIAPTATSAPGFTADGGAKWEAFASPASGWGMGGCLAVNRKHEIVLLPSNNGVGVFSQDGGKNWAPIRLDGRTPTSHFANSFFVTRKNITADKTRPGTFALVYTVIRGDAFDNPLGGVWVTRDGGQSWQQTRKGVIGPGSGDPREVRAQGLEERQFWQCQLDYVPGRSSELVYTPHADYAADRFYWSADDGATWRELHPSIRNVRAFGFGRNLPGRDRPSLFFWGEVGGKPGLYASFDWLATPPRLVTRHPSRMLARVSSVSGDPNQVGRCIVGTSCAGWVQADVAGN